MTSSRRKQNDLVFSFERPETPTEIRGTFSPSLHIPLSANNSLDITGDERDSPVLSANSPITSLVQSRNNNNTSGADSISGSKEQPQFYFSEDEELSAEEQLTLANDRIIELERKLELVERELRSSQERVTKLASQGRRLRRLARSGDLFRRNQPNTENHLDSVDQDAPLEEYVALTITEISASHSFEQSSEAQGSVGVPLYLRRFEGQTFVFGPKGVTIGSGNHCGVWIPEEASVKDSHAIIRWDEVSKEFFLLNGASMDAEICITSIPRLNDESSNDSSVTGAGTIKLQNQLKFRTGFIEWKVSPVPKRKIIISRLFEALRNCNFYAFQELWTYAESWNNYVSQVKSENFSRSSFLIDCNAEEDLDYRIIDEEARRTPKLSDSFTESVEGQQIASYDKPRKFCLLHVAVDYLFFEGVRFLLQNGAEVNKQCGQEKFSPLHIAVKRGSLEITRLLLFHGADLELTDARHLTALMLAGTYQLRKLLLSSLLLCAAAEGGDFEEVQRIIEAGTSPNGKALCHKAPLHLASLNGHVKVVEYLLEHEAFINTTGGRRNRTSLHYASIANNVDVVKVLLRFNADQEVIDSTGYTALNLSSGGENPLSLCLASQAGDINEVRRILDQNASRKGSRNEPSRNKMYSGHKVSQAIANFGRCLAVDQRNEQGHAPLHLASAAGNLELVQLLVSHGATIEIPGGLDKWTALFYAALAGHVDVVRFLLAIGADTTRVDAKGLRVIDHVEQNIDDLKEKLELRSFRESSFDTDGLMQQTQSLLVPAQLVRQKSDSSLDSKAQRSWTKRQIARLEQVLNVLQSGQQKLLNALEQQNLTLFKTTIETEDVKINGPLRKHSHTTALSYAAANGLPEFVEVLLQNHADTNISDGYCLFPIHAAAKAGHEDVIEVLVNHGVDINLQSRNSRQTPLHVAAAHSRKEVVELLVKKGADLEVLDTERQTAYDLAEELEIKSLVASGPNLISLAIAKGNFDALLRKIEVNEMTANTVFTSGLTALQVACQYEQLEVVDMLLKSRAVVNDQGTQNGSSPLHLAVQRNNLSLAKMLVEAGAKLSSTNADGKTPFEVATSNSMRKVLVDSRPSTKPIDLSLAEELSENSGDEELASKNLCRICFDNPANTIILPCGHQAFCKDCASQLEICAFDRRTISQVVPVFKVNED
eukprot:gene14481-5544_t